MEAKVYFVPAKEEGEYYTPVELAKKLNVSRKFIVKHTMRRAIPGQIKIGRIWRYRKTTVQEALDSSSFLIK